MAQLIKVSQNSDIPEIYRNTPIEKLLAYHNFNESFASYSNAEIIIGTCMDNRISLQLPGKFAYIIRTGGANMQQLIFNMSYAIAMANIQHIALIGHDQCGMSSLAEKKEPFINGLINNAGWDRSTAESHFDALAPMFEVEDEVDFINKEAHKFKVLYPKIKIAPMLYKLTDHKLHLISA
jgi:carbonic anhydrase